METIDSLYNKRYLSNVLYEKIDYKLLFFSHVIAFDIYRSSKEVDFRICELKLKMDKRIS